MKDRLLLPMTMKKAKIGALNGQRVRGHLNYPSLSLSLQLQKIVWEVCFCTYMCHVAFESGFRGIIPLRNLLAPPWPAGTAICCCETLDHRRPISLSELLQVCLTTTCITFSAKRLRESSFSSWEQDTCPFMITARDNSQFLFSIQFLLLRFYSVYQRGELKPLLPA